MIDRIPIILFRRSLASFLFCLLMQPWLFTIPAFASNEMLSADAAQAADILGIRKEAEQVISLRRQGVSDENERRQLNRYRSFVLRKILQAVLQVQSAENRLEFEQAHTYDLLSKTQRKINTVNQFFNIFNFLQFGILYTIEPYSRIHKQFKQSSICGSVGAGLGITLPVFCILYNKFVRASNLTPPEYLSEFVDGKPVDGSNLPPLLVKYLDSSAPGSSRSRREDLNSLWKDRYHADMNKRETLCGIDDGKSKNPFVLSSRIVLLWSLHTFIQGFNKDLLSLLNQVRGSEFTEMQAPSTRVDTVAGLQGGAAEAVRLLGLESVIVELNSAKADDERKTELQLTLMETLLSGYLDLQIASEKCQTELNYQYDVVLSSLLSRRGKVLQKTYELNFIQSGILGASASYNFLKGNSKAGNELFIISGAIGIALSTISFAAMHGGWRKNQTEPNSLADFFNLTASGKHGFSHLAWRYLNSPSPRWSDNKTRRQYLEEVWADHAVTNMNLKNPRNLEKLGSMPSCKWDTLRIVRARIALLTSLREMLGQFNTELVDLLRKAWPDSRLAASENVNLPVSPSVIAAAKLIGVQGLLSDVTAGLANEQTKLLITRNVMEGFLDTSANADILEYEILVESQVMSRMIRQRDIAIQLTNIINFYQIGILGVLSSSLQLSSNDQYVLDGNRINVISGYMVSCLALTALLERHGGLRPEKVKANVLSAAFGKKSEYVNLSPMMVRYLDSPSLHPGVNMSKREALVKYWKESKILNVNVKRDSNIQKLSAEGRAHHWWSESINLINNRITMLYDMRAMLRTSNNGFCELLGVVD